MYKKLLFLAFLACGMIFLVVCGETSKEKVATKPKELMLFCGAGIRSAADSLIMAFEKDNNIIIKASYGGSGRLLGQISAMQKGDLFMPGADLYVDLALEKGLADETTKDTVAYFIPVILVKKGNLQGIQGLKSLMKPGLKVGFGDERSCAVGKKTLKILHKNQIDYSDIEKNVVYKSGTVNELGVAIELNTVDAVILWDANARHFTHVGEVVPIPPENNDISTIPIVMLKSSKHPDEAKAFIAFVTSEKGKRILESKGYTYALE